MSLFAPETLGDGAPGTCPTCRVSVVLEVLESPAGFYIGTQCKCGPYTRESTYYPSRKHAEWLLQAGTWVPR